MRSAARGDVELTSETVSIEPTADDVAVAVGLTSLSAEFIVKSLTRQTKWASTSARAVEVGLLSTVLGVEQNRSSFGGVYWCRQRRSDKLVILLLVTRMSTKRPFTFQQSSAQCAQQDEASTQPVCRRSYLSAPLTPRRSTGARPQR